MAAIEFDRLSRRYGAVRALDEVTASIPEHSITGLLGRNGAGKSTLMRILAGYEFPSSGAVRVFGETPAENDAILRRMLLIRETQAYPDVQVRRIVEAASWFYPNWDQHLADRLLRDFDLPPKRQMKKLSRGMASAVGIVVGIAARAEITVLDEPYAGLDAVARQLFYDRLLADVAEHPRTVLLSTHLIDEVADLLENVLVIDHGRLLMSGSVDELRSRAISISGRSDVVREFVDAGAVLGRESLGGRTRVLVDQKLAATDTARARAAGLDLEPVSLQQLVVASSLNVSRED